MRTLLRLRRNYTSSRRQSVRLSPGSLAFGLIVRRLAKSRILPVRTGATKAAIPALHIANLPELRPRSATGEMICTPGLVPGPGACFEIGDDLLGDAGVDVGLCHVILHCLVPVRDAGGNGGRNNPPGRGQHGSVSERSGQAIAQAAASARPAIPLLARG